MSAEPSPSSMPDTLSSLLLRWRELRDRGEECSAEQLCRERPELAEELRRQIEAVESMEQHLGPGGKSTIPLAGPVPAPMGRPPSIDGYEVLEELGRGGMGVVYKARQKGLNRIVALKMILHGPHASPQHLARFKAEAEALGRLRHPNIVHVYEAGEQDGIPFLSLEYIEGGGLDRLLSAGVLPPRDAAGLVRTLARAIHVAHRAGIVHRDLKPANVLLAQWDADGTNGTDGAYGTNLSHTPHRSHSSHSGSLSAVKITDFGLAKQLDAEGQTRSGSVLGTPSYMAPEQAEGRIKEAGPATDVYALGAILYECLTGQPPFLGASAMDTLRQVTSREPLPPSRIQPRVPRDLETICLKCLRKEPGRRYATAEELAGDLERFLEGRPIRARSVGLAERGVKWVKRHRLPTALALLVLLAAGLLALFWPRHPAQRLPDHVLAADSRTILLKYCFPCHGRDGAKVAGGMNILDHARLMASPRRRLVAGDAESSRLIERIEDGSMPPDDREDYPRLASREIETLKTWVEAGAPFFEPATVEEQKPPPPPSPLAVEVRELFQERCYSCHRVGKAENGIKILNHDLLVEKRRLVLPGKVEESPLWQAITGKEVDRMPPKPRPRLAPAQLDTIRRWIEAGAPPFPLKRDPL